jgi:hypothetical protein
MGAQSPEGRKATEGIWPSDGSFLFFFLGPRIPTKEEDLRAENADQNNGMGWLDWGREVQPSGRVAMERGRTEMTPSSACFVRQRGSR